MIGEPDAGNPQVRFDEGMQETGGNVPRLRPTLQHARAGNRSAKKLNCNRSNGLRNSKFLN